jgi:hypothetical protein
MGRSNAAASHDADSILELAEPSDGRDDLQAPFWSDDEDAEPARDGVVAPVAAQVTPIETAALWHRRLAHPGRDALADAVRAEAVTGVKLDARDLQLPGDYACKPRIMGKSHLHPLPSASAPQEGPTDTVVSDLSGKLPVGANGEHYAHLMVHLDTGYSLLGLMTHQTDVPALVMKQLREVERQTRRKIKVFRSDHGGEYVNFKLKDWLWANGVQHQLALPYLPRQKGVGVAWAVGASARRAARVWPAGRLLALRGRLRQRLPQRAAGARRQGNAPREVLRPQARPLPLQALQLLRLLRLRPHT